LTMGQLLQRQGRHAEAIEVFNSKDCLDHHSSGFRKLYLKQLTRRERPRSFMN
jgi:hypothetical protein